MAFDRKSSGYSWVHLLKKVSGQSCEDKPSQDYSWSLLRKGLYTDFRTEAQFLFVAVVCLIEAHPRIFVETQGAGQVLGIDTQPHFALAASIELVERMDQEGMSESTVPPRAAL